MKRQEKRRLERSWDKIPCFSYCERKVPIRGLSNTAVDVFVKVDDGLMLEFNLDMYMRWRLFPIVVIDGFFFRNFYVNLGFASAEWLNEYFDDDEDFTM